MTIYQKAFMNNDGDRMPNHVFHKICEEADWNPDKVLKLAQDDGWSFYPNATYIDLETMVGLSYHKALMDAMTQ